MLWILAGIVILSLVGIAMHLRSSPNNTGVIRSDCEGDNLTMARTPDGLEVRGSMMIPSMASKETLGGTFLGVPNRW